MTFEPSDIDLFVGPDALAVDVFDGYQVRVSMLEVGLPWTFSFWHSELSRAAWSVLIDPVSGVKNGQLVTFAIDGDAVLSGVVETRVTGDDAADRNPPVFVISGRDALASAVAGDADPSLTLRGRTLSDAIQAVYQGVGITADIGASVDPTAVVGRLRPRRVHHAAHHATASTAQHPRRARRGVAHARALYNDAVRASHPRIGEKAHQVVERMCKQLGYRVWTTPVEGSGRTGVIVDRPRTGGTPAHTLRREMVDGRVTERSVLRSGKETTSIASVPTSVTVFGDGQRGDKPAQKIARTVENGFLLTEAALARVDANADLARPRYLQSRSASTEAGARNEAARVCAQANEEFRRYETWILGHRVEGKLVLPNQIVLLTDDLLRIDGERWLITEVDYSYSRESDQRTRISMVPEGALTVIPEPEPS